MKTILFVGAILIIGFLCWGIIAGAHIDEDDDEKAHSGLLEDNDDD